MLMVLIRASKLLCCLIYFFQIRVQLYIIYLIYQLAVCALFVDFVILSIIVKLTVFIVKIYLLLVNFNLLINYLAKKYNLATELSTPWPLRSAVCGEACG